MSKPTLATVRSVAEMTKRRQFLPFLTLMRGEEGGR